MLESSGKRKLGGRDPLRALQRIFAWSLVALFVSLFPSRAHAYTWMIKHGYATCPVCHADPSGGELLTSYGRVQSDELLRMKYGSSSGSAKRDDLMKPLRLVRRTPPPEWKTDAAAGADDEDEAKPADAKAADAKPADAKPADADKAAADKPAADKPKDADAEEKPDADEDEEVPPPPPTTMSSAADESSPGDFLWGLVKLPDWLLLGGSYRHMNLYRPGLEGSKFRTFPMMADLYGQVQFGGFRAEASIGAARVDVGSPYARASQVTGAQGKDWNLLSRTHWIGYDVTPEITVRGGRMNLPFGVRIPEHTMWVRQNTRTDRESSQQHGVAVSYNGDKIRGEAMIILGNYQVNPDKYRERGYSLFAEYMVGAQTGLGISSLVTTAKQDRVQLDRDVLRQVHGAFIRSALTENLVILAEVDGLIRTHREAGYVGFAQLDYEITRGLHLIGTGEILDEGHVKGSSTPRTAGAGQPRFGAWGGVDWFCLPHVEVRADLMKRQQDETTIMAQLHVFL